VCVNQYSGDFIYFNSQKAYTACGEEGEFCSILKSV